MLWDQSGRFCNQTNATFASWEVHVERKLHGVKSASCCLTSPTPAFPCQFRQVWRFGFDVHTPPSVCLQNKMYNRIIWGMTEHYRSVKRGSRLKNSCGSAEWNWSLPLLVEIKYKYSGTYRERVRARANLMEDGDNKPSFMGRFYSSLHPPRAHFVPKAKWKLSTTELWPHYYWLLCVLVWLWRVYCMVNFFFCCSKIDFFIQARIEQRRRRRLFLLLSLYKFHVFGKLNLDPWITIEKNDDCCC